ncbi:hypothetical protein I4F81_010618 [Pyropia yezoensis]|uniref:Uncharacterized protein n=1 Tax=Pyropia yezoensis TaxID=2788 RepID=A0ACC3CE49_PYRYE|nr:hypothetical protein I4F81_010618 [Neopyropia yezoensis]
MSPPAVTDARPPSDPAVAVRQPGGDDVRRMGTDACIVQRSGPASSKGHPCDVSTVKGAGAPNSNSITSWIIWPAGRGPPPPRRWLPLAGSPPPPFPRRHTFRRRRHRRRRAVLRSGPQHWVVLECLPTGQGAQGGVVGHEGVYPPPVSAAVLAEGPADGLGYEKLPLSDTGGQRVLQQGHVGVGAALELRQHRRAAHPHHLRGQPVAHAQGGGGIAAVAPGRCRRGGGGGSQPLVASEHVPYDGGGQEVHHVPVRHR